jgi:hypothetical protein
MRYDAAKAAFLEYLEGEVEKIDRSRSCTLTEKKTSPSPLIEMHNPASEVYQAANELVDALQG